jgi:type IV secretion system protein TrbL
VVCGRFAVHAVFGWDLWRNYHGDLRQALLSTTNKILILGFFLALLMNGQTWMSDIINMFVTIGKQASGVPSLSPSMLLLQGFKIFGTLLEQATKSGLMLDLATAVALILGALVICAAFLLITFQFIVTQVQTFLAIGMGYLFLAFGGSRWTANYVERYFAYSVASGVKLMVLYMLAGAAWPLTTSWIMSAQAGPLSSASVESCWVVMCGAVLYAGIVWFASSQVSQMFGGSPNLTHSDFVSFLTPAVSAGVTSALIAAGVFTGGVTTVAGAAGSAAGAAAKTAAGAAASAATPSGNTPPQPSANSGGGFSQAARAAGNIAQIGASAMGRMPHGGSHSAPPRFTAFSINQ